MFSLPCKKIINLFKNLYTRLVVLFIYMFPTKCFSLPGKPKFDSNHISIFDQNLDFWPKFCFLTKISIFDQNFDFWPKFRFSIKISIFDQNSGFWIDLWVGPNYGTFFDKLFITILSSGSFCGHWSKWWNSRRKMIDKKRAKTANPAYILINISKTHYFTENIGQATYGW